MTFQECIDLHIARQTPAAINECTAVLTPRGQVDVAIRRLWTLADSLEREDRQYVALLLAGIAGDLRV